MAKSKRRRKRQPTRTASVTGRYRKNTTVRRAAAPFYRTRTADGRYPI